MGKVEVRRGFHDYPSTFDVADKKAGRRLDRRKNYMIIDGKVCHSVSFTQSCSGCCESGDYGGMLQYYEYDDKAKCHIGSGCYECGYTGKARGGTWIPLNGEL